MQRDHRSNQLQHRQRNKSTNHDLLQRAFTVSTDRQGAGRREGTWGTEGKKGKKGKCVGGARAARPACEHIWVSILTRSTAVLRSISTRLFEPGGGGGGEGKDEPPQNVMAHMVAEHRTIGRGNSDPGPLLLRCRMG